MDDKCDSVDFMGFVGFESEGFIAYPNIPPNTHLLFFINKVRIETIVSLSNLE